MSSSFFEKQAHGMRLSVESSIRHAAEKQATSFILTRVDLGNVGQLLESLAHLTQLQRLEISMTDVTRCRNAWATLRIFKRSTYVTIGS
jgi:hypothetical protein